MLLKLLLNQHSRLLITLWYYHLKIIAGLKIYYNNVSSYSPLTSFADVLWAFIPAYQRLLYGVWNSFPKNQPITANFPYFGKLAFDLYDLRANVSINMADIDVGFVNVCEKFWNKGT